MKTSTIIGSSFAGACAVTLIHETVRKVVPEAPRMDLLGKGAISKGLSAAGMKTPPEDQLFTWALAGDLAANTIYYSLAGIGKKENALLRGSLLGLAAGVGAVILPKPLGLNPKHSNKTIATQLMTVGLYVAGGLVTAAVARFMERKKTKKQQEWEHRLVTSAMG